MEWCVLVNEQDEVIGQEEKLKVHLAGQLHRAFSVFILNDKKEILLQKRAAVKYHSAGLWTNSCCSHPQPGESVVVAGERRLQEELGFTTNLKPSFSFIYKAELDNGLIEHEFDHVLIGHYSESFEVNKDEVEETRFIALEDLKSEWQKEPARFTSWLGIILDQHYELLERAIQEFH